MINVRIQHKEVQKLSPKITVVGVGGAGGNAVNNMIGSGLQGCEFVVCNTDAQALEGSLCENKVQLGVTVTGGLGAGAKPDVGRGAAEESLDEIMRHLDGSNMVFITAGMGGGTGTGAAPVVARACREKGILTVGVVTKPFHFEGSRRMQMAEQGIDEMQQYVDTLIVIPNQNLFRVANEKTTFAEAFRLADSVLQSAVRGVTDLMVIPGQVNLDFSDIRTVMQEMGKAMMGAGEATGERRAIEASEKAINNPLLDDVSMKGARAVIVNVTGGADMTLFEIDEACNRIRDEVDPNANIIFGSSFDPAMEGAIRVSIVATGIDVAETKARASGGGKGFGPHIINALTAQQQAGRIERAQPATADTVATGGLPYHAASAAAQQSVYEPQGVAVARAAAIATAQRMPMTAGMTASAASGSAYGAATARRVEDPEVDLFEQQEFVREPAYGYAGKKPEAASSPAGVVAAGNPQGAAPRGTIYNESYIPPQPVEVQGRDGAGYGPQFSGLTATRPVQSQEASSSSGVILRPPVPGASAQPKKRTPSLFERFTGPLRHHDDSNERSSGHPADAGMRVSQRPAQQPPLQGSLNIDAPSASRPADTDDELDIPAFLRRQAN